MTASAYARALYPTAAASRLWRWRGIMAEEVRRPA
jgi:hypothetical protein